MWSSKGQLSHPCFRIATSWAIQSLLSAYTQEREWRYQRHYATASPICLSSLITRLNSPFHVTPHKFWPENSQHSSNNHAYVCGIHKRLEKMKQFECPYALAKGFLLDYSCPALPCTPKGLQVLNAPWADMNAKWLQKTAMRRALSTNEIMYHVVDGGECAVDEVRENWRGVVHRKENRDNHFLQLRLLEKKTFPIFAMSSRVLSLLSSVPYEVH
jgi:hypothetical protein